MAVMAMIDEAGLAGLPAAQLGARTGTEPRRHEPLVAMLERSGQATLQGSFFVSSAHLDAARHKLDAIVADYHAKRPIEDGIAREELRERVCGGAPATVFEYLVATAVKAGQIVARDRVALAGRSLALTDREVHARDTIQMTRKHAIPLLEFLDRAHVTRRVGNTRQIL